MPDAFITDWVRTPRGKVRGRLAGYSAVDLVCHLQSALDDRGLAPVEDVVLGVASQVDEQGADLARTANLRSGWQTPGLTVNRFCASGIDAVALAAARIRSGDLASAVAGGVETVSRVPIFADRGMLWSEPYSIHMGVAADLNAALDGWTRAQLDEYAVETHTKAAAAWESGAFDRSVVGLPELARDELIREVSAEKLAQLAPIFTDEAQLEVARQRGPVTPMHTVGTSPQMADAAALLALTNDGGRARIVASATAAVDPIIMLTAGQVATEDVLAKAGLSARDIDVFEFAEAFSALCLRFRRDLAAGPDRMNPSGGTMAMGHAFGATGAILIGQCVDELEDRGGRYGVAAVSGAAGLGSAVLIERISG